MISTQSVSFIQFVVFSISAASVLHVFMNKKQNVVTKRVSSLNLIFLGCLRLEAAMSWVPTWFVMCQ